MTFIRVKAIGSGASTDPVRSDFPTAGFVGYDPVSGLITVDIPDADMPPNIPPPGDATRPNTPYGPVLIGVPATSMQPWTATLRARYPNKGANWNPPAVQ